MSSPTHTLPSRSRRAALAVLTALTLAVSLLVSPSPANADAAKGAWTSFHTICNGCTVDEGNLIRFWQTIVMAHYFGPYHGMNCSFVDGSFGPNTRDWTKRAQRALGVDDDGIVGPNTWQSVRDRLVLAMTSDESNIYTFWNGSATFGSGKRMSIQYLKASGYWRFYDYCGSGSYVYLNHS